MGKLVVLSLPRSIVRIEVYLVICDFLDRYCVFQSLSYVIDLNVDRFDDGFDAEIGVPYSCSKL